MMPFDPAGAFGAMTAAAVGAAAGWLLVRIAGGWVATVERESVDGAVIAPRRRPDSAAWWVAVAFLLATFGLWWWEVHLRGGLPPDATGPIASPEVVAGRWLAHVALLWFLAAATWTDIRFRVIPDWITVSGLLLGLVSVWAWPTILLPVTTLLARDIAVPLEVPDVLGWAGPLLAPPHPAPRAAPGMLLAAMGMFAVWWRIGTGPDLAAPAEEAPTDGGEAATGTPTGDGPVEGHVSPRREPGRWVILTAGLAGIVAVWWGGGMRFEALFSSLLGVLVAGGLVWATRAGASAAMGIEAMGLGDVTLMAMVGAWLGWQASVLGCFIGVFVGLVHGVTLLALGRGNELPFGPGLCAGTALAVVAWRAVWLATADSFAEPWRIAAVLAAVVAGTAVSLWLWGMLSARARRSFLVAALVLVALLVAWVSATTR